MSVMCLDQGDISSRLQNKDLNPALSGQIICHCIDTASLRMSSMNHALLAHCTESHLSYLCKWEIILSSKTLVLPFLRDTFWCLIFPSKVWSPSLYLDLSLLCSPLFFLFCLFVIRGQGSQTHCHAVGDLRENAILRFLDISKVKVTRWFTNSTTGDFRISSSYTLCLNSCGCSCLSESSVVIKSFKKKIPPFQSYIFFQIKVSLRKWETDKNEFYLYF